MEVLHAVIDVIVVNKDKRRGCLWLQGVKRSGKTTWLDIICEIFPACTLDLKDEKYQSVEDYYDNTILATMNDIKSDNLTRHDNIENVKNLFEGRGIKQNTKMGTKQTVLKNVYTLITSNDLPRLARADYEI